MTINQLVTHILDMKTKDETYARSAAKFYSDLMPWLCLNAAIRAERAKRESSGAQA